jgi:hypothetical protein
MLRHHQLQGVLCVALTVTALLLTSCTQDRIEPAPVSLRGINKTINSTAPMVATPLAPPQYGAPSARRAVTAERSAAAHRAMPSDHASGGAVIKRERSASAHKMHSHRAPQMAGVVRGTAKAHRAAKSAGSATTLARSHPESIPLDEPVTSSAEQTTPAWVQPAPAEAPQQQLRPPAP